MIIDAKEPFRFKVSAQNVIDAFAGVFYFCPFAEGAKEWLLRSGEQHLKQVKVGTTIANVEYDRDTVRYFLKPRYGQALKFFDDNRKHFGQILNLSDVAKVWPLDLDEEIEFSQIPKTRTRKYERRRSVKRREMGDAHMSRKYAATGNQKKKSLSIRPLGALVHARDIRRLQGL